MTSRTAITGAPAFNDDSSGPTDRPPQMESPNSDPFDSGIKGRLRSASKTFQESNPPSGAWDAAGNVASSAASMKGIQGSTYGNETWSQQDHSSAEEGVDNSSSQSRHYASKEVRAAREGEPHNLETIPSLTAANNGAAGQRHSSDSVITPNATSSISKKEPAYRTTPFDNGYEFPPKHTWQQATVIGLKEFWKFTCTWLGFLIVVYGLNVVAWGGMIFLLLCNASPAMCTPSCNDIDSPRRIWIEIDAQVLTALFCVTGFGLIPWRFRDLWYLMKYRLMKNEIALRRLAGIHRGWFRLAGSQELPAELGPDTIETESSSHSESCLPFPLKSIPEAPLTGVRAPATAVWKLDFVIWMYVWNTFLQAVLSGIMWGLNRYDRPSWATGLFVALACMVAAAGGIEVFIEGKKVKGIEGVPVSPADLQKLRHDREAGVIHINNLSGKLPKEKTKKGGRRSFARKMKRDENSGTEMH